MESSYNYDYSTSNVYDRDVLLTVSMRIGEEEGEGTGWEGLGWRWHTINATLDEHLRRDLLPRYHVTSGRGLFYVLLWVVAAILLLELIV